MALRFEFEHQTREYIAQYVCNLMPHILAVPREELWDFSEEMFVRVKDQVIRELIQDKAWDLGIPLPYKKLRKISKENKDRISEAVRSAYGEELDRRILRTLQENHDHFHRVALERFPPNVDVADMH